MTKYGNRRVEYDGYVFDSRAEWCRYLELKLLASQGTITDLKVHPKYVLQPAFRHNGRTEKAITYSADFQYQENGRLVVEDVKGYPTQLFHVKRKLFVFKYPYIDFRMVKV